ncbi:class I SAM-dependent methyltransferase [Natrialbaceae archaeon A-CW3]
MTDTDHPIDWNEYWTDADDADYESATPSTHHLTGLVPALIDAKGTPETVADVGCGPGVLTFDLSERYPDATVVGYDTSDVILEENRERARLRGLENARFERTTLPAFDPDRQFDLVCCYATLCYVADTADALRALYDAVAPGGHLVLGYITEAGRNHYHGRLEEPEAWRDRDPDFDPQGFARRFRLVLEGESTLSETQIEDALGTPPRQFWEFTEKPAERWAWDHVPLVWVPKEATTDDENTPATHQ